jgi:tetratricopeptide (TPR) repeat protein
LLQGDIKKAAEVLDHETYGPAKLIEKQGAPDEKFAIDLYSTELKIVVRRMTSDDGDPQVLLDRAIAVMEKLRASVTGPNAQKRLTQIFMDMATEISQQLDKVTPDKKAKLIDAFRLFLDRISATSDDPATLTWVGNTLMDLAEASMQPNQTKAKGRAAELLTSVVKTFDRLKKKSEKTSPEVSFQLGKANRLLGNYKISIDVFTELLTETPMMLDAQIEAAQAYESWAGVVAPKYAGKAYSSALNGARPGADKKNTIWGWGRISQLTNGKPQFDAIFFDARYHVALCRYKQGLAKNDKRIKEQAISDISTVNALYPDLGGDSQRKKFDALLRVIQKDLGKPVQGLPKVKAKK